MEKIFNGKAIYTSKGKAGEYSKYACNFYVGCSNQCEYCYLRKGIGKATLGGDTPTLKKCFKDESHALEVFEKELKANLPELQKHGLFFSFTTDPFLTETIKNTIHAIMSCVENKVTVKILTKRSDFFIPTSRDYHGENLWKLMWGEIISLEEDIFYEIAEYVAFGFTLTGHDEMEPGASTNWERIKAMRTLHNAGFKTWASIEPIIDFKSSTTMIDDAETAGCDLFKIGLERGKKYNKKECASFVHFIASVCASKIYFKDSLLKAAGIRREDLPANCVTSDYNIFNNK